MKTKRNYDEANVIRSLNRKRGINVVPSYMPNSKGCIEVEKDATDVGNGSWGKIDFLVNYCGYIVLYVSRIKKKHIVPIEEDEQEITPKINMANMVRDTMKKYKL